MKQKKIAIIGCGLIGQAWATVFLRSGHRVTLYDKQDGAVQKAVVQIQERLVELHEHGLITADALNRCDDLLTVVSTLKAAVSDADYIQENGPEDAAIKTELTREIDRWSPTGAPIGSSTSGIPASVYAQEITGRRRCLVVHPINPPHLIPVVEIVPTRWTSKTVVDEVKDLLDGVGQVPIILKKEIDGFVVNRLQGALLREAFQLLDHGVASREAIDKAISDGLGIRWSLMGPFETIHLNAPGGVADYVTRFGQMYSEMFLDTREPADWGAVVNSGLEVELIEQQPLAEIGNAQRARDIALMQLLAGRLQRVVEDKSDI
ncbi:MAG: 3-hydroxyacyl-CoA dehydrogenase [Pseudomonadota bacterium]